MLLLFIVRFRLSKSTNLRHFKYCAKSVLCGSIFCVFLTAAMAGKAILSYNCWFICSFFTIEQRGSVKARHTMAPANITIDDVIIRLPIVTSGDTIAPPTNDAAPNMALAAPALLRSLSMAMAVLTGCINPKHMSMNM